MVILIKQVVLFELESLFKYARASSHGSKLENGIIWVCLAFYVLLLLQTVYPLSSETFH